MSDVKVQNDVQRATPTPELPPPTLTNVAYGSHERQVLDLWQARSSRPAPVLFHIHGGGWTNGDKSRITPELGENAVRCLAAGISVVSINYRYLVRPPLSEPLAPVRVPLYDAARALQFIRSKAREWNLDSARIALTGGSAGGCTALWLAFHRDLADASSSDPVARQSTRPFCAAVLEAQTTLDPQQMKLWIPNSRYGGHAFGFAWDCTNPMAEFEQFLANRERILPWILEYSPYTLAAPGAPPIYLFHGMDRPAYGQDRDDPTHTANFGALLKEKLDRIGVECELVYPSAPGVRHVDIGDYLIDKLLSTPFAPET